MAGKKNTDTNTGRAKRVLLVFFSFSGQASGLSHHLADGLENEGIQVVQERIKPVKSMHFPFGSVLQTLKMMFLTCFRYRVPILPLSEQCYESYDLIILAGPTWSYNPSGPILALLDRDGKKLFDGKTVLPLISCRRYWRTHYWHLRRRLISCGAHVINRVVFSHPTKEPWVSLGVFFKLAGKNPERSKYLGKYYRKYGHTKNQFHEVEKVGGQIGKALMVGNSLEDLSLPPF